MSQATVARQRNIPPKPRKIVTCMEKQQGRAAVGWGLNGRWVGLGGFGEGSTRVRVGWAGRAGPGCWELFCGSDPYLGRVSWAVSFAEMGR